MYGTYFKIIMGWLEESREEYRLNTMTMYLIIHETSDGTCGFIIFFSLLSYIFEVFHNKKKCMK